jgi:hypothetical protein
MGSILKDFEVEKPLPSVITINSAENYLYSIGLSLFSSKPQTRNRFHNPFFISLIICVSILKSITAILMKEDKYRLLFIGDFAYFINGRYFINFAIILWGSLAFSSQILHYWKYYKNESPSYLKTLDMISGLVSPKSIGLINREDINELLKKSKLMFKISEFSIIWITICAFFTSFIPLIIISSFQLFLIEIFWSLLYTVFVYFSTNINLYQMTYFYIICLYLKLKIRNTNTGIRKNFETKLKMTYNKMKNILKTLDSIISEINTYNNDLWSQYLMIVLMLVITALDLILFQSIFGKMSLFFKIILIYGSSILFLSLITLLNTASSVSFEANKSYKLLNKLFITKNRQISIRMRVKVCIQTIKSVFKSIFLF